MIKNIFRLKNELVVTMENGKEFKTSSCTDDLYNTVKDNKDITEDELNHLFYPVVSKAVSRFVNVKKSSILKLKNNSAYIPSISNLTVPQMLVDRIIEAENTNNEDALTAYKNFWTLLSLNPNESVRNNLFWFLDKWNMSICKSGLIIAYRNVWLKEEGLKYNQELTDFISCQYYRHKTSKKNPENVFVYSYNNTYKVCYNMNSISDEAVYIGNLKNLYESIVSTNDNAGTVYTDDHTHTMEIRLGHIVSIPRKDCDERQVSCSRGLHAGAKGWLKNNYCGNIGLKILINPTDVCSVPKEDNYGKMRTCAYYPIQIIKFDRNGDVIDNGVQDGFEADFIDKISYEGTINNVDNDNYVLNMVEDFNINKEEIYKKLKNIAQSIKRKV